MQLQNSAVGNLIEPAPTSFSFDAPGWYILLVTLMLLMVLLTGRYLIRKRKNKYRKLALEKVQQLALQNSESQSWEINKVLKGICMNKYGRGCCAALTGKDWFDFLNGKCKTPVFNQEAMQAYMGIYDHSIESHQPFLDASIKWIHSHEL
jgi:hypothetical protein